MRLAENKIAELEAQRDLLSAENRRLELENAGISTQVGFFCDFLINLSGAAMLSSSRSHASILEPPNMSTEETLTDFTLH